MTDYISREALKKVWDAECDKCREGRKFSSECDPLCFQCVLMDVMMEVIELPAADVRENKRGEWYGEADGYADGELVYDMWSCPICGKRFEEWEEKPDWNFCPNCGADMRTEVN